MQFFHNKGHYYKVITNCNNKELPNQVLEREARVLALD